MRQVQRKPALDLPHLRESRQRRADGEARVSVREQALAWTVHFITASGAIFGLLAVIAVQQEAWLFAFLWMAAAIAVDSADGTLARIWQVKRVLPHFDGALLDNIVDFLTYVIVPALFLYGAGMLPEGLGWVGAAMITLASAYQFCQAEAKTEDNYFLGFPSYWNVVVFYMFLVGLDPWLNFAAVALLSILVFIPTRYIYPSRTLPFRRLTLVLTVAWGISCLVILAQYPEPHPALVNGSLLFIGYFFAMSFYLHFREP
jgi:phosphatidylcholine synthase